MIFANIIILMKKWKSKAILENVNGKIIAGVHQILAATWYPIKTHRSKCKISVNIPLTLIKIWKIREVIITNNNKKGQDKAE